MAQGKLFVSRDERQYKLMQMFEKRVQQDKLELASFYQ